MDQTDAMLALATFAFVSSITPGPNNLMLMASGTNFGFRRTVPHLLGVCVGFTAMVVLVGAGLSTVFTRFPAVHIGLEAASVVYLLYLAWRIASAESRLKPVGAAPEGRPLTFLQAALFQWFNPKAWTMALTAASAYAPNLHSPIALVLVALVFGLINLPSVGMWTLLGVQLHRILDDPLKLRIFNVTAALLLVASLYPVAVETVSLATRSGGHGS